jgi:uncharacterized protein YebE (UPF0316 family)
MSLLWTILLYALVGGSEWFMAIRRMVATARGETTILVSLVFIENIVSLWVLSRFIVSNDWGIAIAYATGGSIGAYLVMKMNKNELVKKE